MLRNIIEHLPEHSALYQQRNPDHWSLSDQLLATVVDSLEVGNWQRQGKKGARKPDRIPRPGVGKTQATTYGSTVMSRAEADAWLEGAGMTFTTTANDLII